MRNGTIKPTAGILFILSVLVPSLFLGFFALRAVDREEAYIEKRFEDTLLAYVIHTSSVISNEIEKINDELAREFTAHLLENEPEDLYLLAEENRLINIPFLVTPDFNILWPDENLKLTGPEDEFLTYNSEFLTNEISIPMYENIAIAYKDIIINEQRANTDISASLDNNDADSKNKNDSGNDDWSGENFLKQNAIIQFEQDENVRNRVYEQAVEEGNEVGLRTVVQVQEKKANPESMFISRHLTFSQITEGKDKGLIPRITDDTLTLFFWLKTDSGQIAGCILTEEAFRDRLLKNIQNVYTKVRILTILDERGIPLLIPEENRERNWKIPLVSREISEILPRWEAAAYLTDPEIISTQARSIAVVMWVLIFILIISILIGGILILKSFYSEIILAQQKTTFVSNVSHELKTPLTSIRLFAEMLKEERQPDKVKQKKYLGLMVSETERLTRLIGNVLDFSRMGQKKKQYNKENIDITGLCRTLMEGQRLRLEQKDFALKFSASTDNTKVFADSESLKQAILNLISNAEKYSTGKKAIEMELSLTDGYVLIKIKDRGIGIPAKHAKKIFKEFYRIDDSLTSRVRGSGLGLTIAAKIITGHNGSISHIPNPGGGSIFRIKLPVLKKENR